MKNTVENIAGVQGFQSLGKVWWDCQDSMDPYSSRNLKKKKKKKKKTRLAPILTDLQLDWTVCIKYTDFNSVEIYLCLLWKTLLPAAY